MLKHGTKHAMAEISESAGDIIEDLGVEESVEHAQDRAGRFYKRASSAAHGVKNLGLEQYHLVRRQVRRNAMASTLIAFATGFVVSRFLFHR